MSDRQRLQISEEQEDDLLQALFDEAAEAEGEMLWKDYEAGLKAGTVPEIPEALDAKCRELIRTSKREWRRIQFRKFICKGTKHAAIIIVALLLLVSTSVMTVDAIKIPVMNFVVGSGGRYSTILFGERLADVTEEETFLDRVLSTRLPLGYEMKSVSQKKNGGFFCLFQNQEEGMIKVNVIPSEEMIDFDMEDANQTSTNIYDWPALYIEKSGHRVIWFNSDYNYACDVNTTGLDESEFWKYVYRLAK